MFEFSQPFDNNNDNNEFKSRIQTDALRELANGIVNNKPYINYLIRSYPLHEKLILVITDAIQLHQEEEKYEICASLLNFKTNLQTNIQ